MIQTKTIKIMMAMGVTMMVMIPAMIYTVDFMVPGFVVLMQTSFIALEMAN